MTDRSPPRHSARYYAIVGALMLIAVVIGFALVEEAGWVLVLTGCFLGGFLAEWIADLVRYCRNRR
ncbi:hypothetical protein [Saccharothrix sp. Mg75]|uniref:hypothetical protein n=1 Tax=Saccharothrix sp. Mg75 TaxID=3445357 RepID=UPI003EEF8313